AVLVVLLGYIGEQSIVPALFEQPTLTADKHASGDGHQDIDNMTVESIEKPASVISEAMLHVTEVVSEQIKSGFEALTMEHADTRQALTGFVESVRAIRESLAELRERHDALKKRIIDAQSSLHAIAQEVHGLKLAQKKKAATRRKGAARSPPFHVDAIDLWDGAVYVAISQKGQVAFLREGEQRSGWAVILIDRTQGRVELRGPQGQQYSTSIRQ
ncbi:MAG: hypothetical protein GY896_11935, partial [Gammaproteobacteria bacterium]|nr:hypothetical protein [Gammaproteobacteria bacterium]